MLLRAIALCTAMCPLAAMGCVVGDDEGNADDSTTVLGARGNPADTLRWRGFSSGCVSPADGYATSGGSLSAFFDTTTWSTCTTSGVLVVPAGIRITGVHQFVRGDGGWPSIQYSASLDGTRITSRSVNATLGLETTANVNQIGARICARAGTSARSVRFSFTITQSPGKAITDSVDWEIEAEHCEE